jgi:hypothetical protein
MFKLIIHPTIITAVIESAAVRVWSPCILVVRRKPA